MTKMGHLNSENANCQRSLYDRVEKLLVSFEWSDCSFSVSGTIIKAHKLILGISSPVFEAMFYGPLSSKDAVLITDIQPDIFQLIINYIYTDRIDISNIEQAFELLYASRKYMLKHLADMCIAYIQANISVDNVIEVLNYPDYMLDKQLILFALELFCEHAEYLLQEKKNIISHSCMKSILECNQMNVTEKDLIKYVFQWSSYCCEQNNLSITFENRRELLNKYGIFKLLRFLTLNLDELKEVISDENNLLLISDSEDIKKLIKSKNSIEQTDIMKAPICLIDIPRNVLKLHWHLCYRSPIRSVAPIVIDVNNYKIYSRFKSNKSVFINSLCVPTRVAPLVHFSNNMTKMYSEQLSVSIMCEASNSIIKLTNFMNTVEYESMVDIELTEPCFIKKDEWYKICFIWPHNRCQIYLYMVELRDHQYAGHKVLFEFDDIGLNVGNGGSFLSGLKFCL